MTSYLEGWGTGGSLAFAAANSCIKVVIFWNWEPKKIIIDWMRSKEEKPEKGRAH